MGSGLTTGVESETGMTSGAEKIILMSREVEGLMAGLGRVGASIRICDGTG